MRLSICVTSSHVRCNFSHPNKLKPLAIKKKQKICLLFDLSKQLTTTGNPEEMLGMRENKAHPLESNVVSWGSEAQEYSDSLTV